MLQFLLLFVSNKLISQGYDSTITNGTDKSYFNFSTQFYSLKAFFYVDSTDKMLFTEVKDKVNYAKFTKPNGHTLWFKLLVANKIDKAQNYYLTIHPLLFNEVYVDADTSNYLYKNPSNFERFEIPIPFEAFENKVIWVKVKNIKMNFAFEPQLLSYEGYTKYTTTRKSKDLKLFTFLLLIIGFLFITSIYGAVQGFVLKSRTYYYWSIYLFFTSLTFIAEFGRSFDLGLLHLTKTENVSNYQVEVQFLVVISYLLFVSSFLNLKTASRKLYYFVSGINAFIVTNIILSILLGKNPIVSQIINYSLLFGNFLILVLLIAISISKIKQSKLIIIGSALLLLFASISILTDLPKLFKSNNFFLLTIVQFSIGVVLELLFFTLALSRRTQLLQLENFELQKNYTKNLETELANRIEINQQQNKILEAEKIKNITTEFEQKIVESEISALRAQMNPHFIFNCLNSIEFYNANNQPELASEYLNKFSRLIRLVLENSRSEKVSLENEINTLRLYLEMEAMRFRGKIEYKINMAGPLDDIEIPPLLIQPFVENAIWHGLMHKDAGGFIHINLKTIDENLLQIEIIDNGIGRLKAAEIKSKSATKNKSFGMKVTAERIELINQLYKTETKIKIDDLVDENGLESGTKVTVVIPI